MNNEVLVFLKSHKVDVGKNFLEQVSRVKFNENMLSYWFMAITELTLVMTMLSMMLPAVALIKEKETSTIEHLLVMPLKPAEIMLAKIWANSLILMFSYIVSLMLIIQTYFRIKVQGSMLLLLFGLAIFQFSVASLGMMLATFARNTSQLALVVILFMMPMVFLSGSFTPPESMHPFMQNFMFLSPLKHCMDFVFALIFRGAGISELWKSLVIMFGIGVGTFSLSLMRFRTWFNSNR